MSKRLYISRLILFLLAATQFTHCSKFVTVDTPNTQLSSPVVFSSDATALASLGGLYSRMMPLAVSFWSGAITLNTGLAGDEMVNYSTSTTVAEFYKNAIVPTNSTIRNLWTEAYQLIYHSNAILEGVAKSDQLTSATRQQIKGEATFIRAFCYFYLVNLWGDIPLVTSTDYQANANATRTASKEVYAFIVQSLQTAITELTDGYASAERVRPNAFAARALLARVYLFQGMWPQAEATASTLINASTTYALETDPGGVFLKGSKETIWQLMPVQPGYNTSEAVAFIFTDVPPNVALNPQLVAGIDTADKRRLKWIGSNTVSGNTYYYPYKYKATTSSPMTEYYVVLRLAEQYLIRAESRFQQDNFSGGVDDLNLVRQRAGLSPFSSSIGKDQLLTVLLRERQIELFAEWGHRWFDLKRTGRIDSTLATVKSGWQATDALFPLPQNDLVNAPQLTQNPGY